MKKWDENGNPNIRQCTCKECGEKFTINWEEEEVFCPKCGALHCPACLKSIKKAEMMGDKIAGPDGTSESYWCPHCGFTIFDYEY